MKYFLTSRPDVYKAVFENNILEPVEMISLEDAYKFADKLKTQKGFQYDSEYNPVPNLYYTRITMAQFGEFNYEGDQLVVELGWFIEAAKFSLEDVNKMRDNKKNKDGSLFRIPKQDLEDHIDSYRMADVELFDFCRYLLDDPSLAKIIHHALADVPVALLAFKCLIVNIKDTYVMSKIVSQGYDSGSNPSGQFMTHSLAQLLELHFQYKLDKTEQTSFICYYYRMSQIIYAGEDVRYLKPLADKLFETIAKEKTQNHLQMNLLFLPAICLMNTQYFEWDREGWVHNAKELAENAAQSKIVLNEMLYEERFEDVVKYNNFIQQEDEYLFNWNGNSLFKKKVLSKVIQGVGKLTKANLLKVRSELLITDPCSKILKLIELYIMKDWNVLGKYLINNYHDLMNEEGFFVPKGTIHFNINSSDQRLKLLRVLDPKLKSTDKKNLLHLDDPLVYKWFEFSKANKLSQSYGEGFDRFQNRFGGMAMEKINTILATGRISCSNLTLLPGKNSFRNCFKVPYGWVLVDSDYSSAEIVSNALRSQDPVWLEIIRSGSDLHMSSALKIFGQEFIDAAEPDCSFLKNGHKCDCPGHADLRKKSKALTFGLFFGLSEIGLAMRLQISRPEARKLISMYWNTFSVMKSYFDAQAAFGLANLYIREQKPCCGVRHFSRPFSRGEESSIMRQSMNFNSQASTASALKYACVLVQRFAVENNYPVQVLAYIHDELICAVPFYYADDWAKRQTGFLEAGGLRIFPSGDLKADTDVAYDGKWYKDFSKSPSKEVMIEKYKSEGLDVTIKPKDGFLDDIKCYSYY